MQRRKTLAVLLFALFSSPMVWPQTPATAGPMRDLLSIRPTDRISLSVSNTQRVVLSGQRHPLARPEYSIGKATPDLYMGRMVLVLRPDVAQDAALEELIRAQHDPASPYYHQWLTPEQYGKSFGISARDLKQVTAWLQSFGMEVEEIPASRRALVFSGTAAQVKAAFHASIHKYLIKGETHYANANDPEIPQALAPVVRGVVSLHDFRSASSLVVAPHYTAANGVHFLMPQDWATIYDVTPLYKQGLDGTGQSIAVLGRVDVAMSDVRTFRTNAGLPPNDPQMIINGPDPGYPWCDDELESALDVEWAGAIAGSATIKFVTSQSTSAADGITLSAQYAVNHNVAPIVTLSYGLCEAALGTAGNAFWNSTWAQAAAQGMSVFVSSGDSGAAGCDSPSLKTARQGRGVNGLCSTPYSTCVGGTQFDDTYNSGQYWSPANNAGQSSALSYIPELAWNESSWAGGLWAGGGGASILYSKPGWQAAPGVPADGRRDVPDVALHGSIQDAYIVQIQGSTFYVSGTSAATPALASVMAMVLEKAGGAQGNANPQFYALANQQISGAGAAVFHDVTGGNNSVPGVTGFNAGAGFDQATGLGSVDASLLVNHWSDASQVNFTLTPNVASVSVAPGGTATATITMIGQGGFSTPVALTASGVPAGVTVKFSSVSVSSASPVTVTFTAASSAALKSTTITISGTGGGLTRTATIAVTVVAPGFSMTPSATTASILAGGSTSMTVSTLAAGGFKSAITLSAGLPSGVTASFSPASIASPGNGTSTLTIKAVSSATGGIRSLTLKATGGGVTSTASISLTVTVPTFALTANSASVTVTAGSTAGVVVNSTAINGFNSAVALSVSGLPRGITAKFAPTSIASPGNGSSTLTLTAVAGTVGGSYTLTVTGSGGGLTKTQALSLTVVGPTFTLSLGGTSVVLARGGSIPLTVSTSGNNGFASAITLSVSALPKGVTATFAPASIATPGTGSSSLTIKAASTATVGTTTITVTASGGGVAKTQAFTLKVR